MKNAVYSKKPVNPQNRYISDEGKLLKLSRKRVTAFENNAVEYNLTIRNNMDPLKQILLLNSRKTYLISKKLDQLKGVKCNEILEVTMEKQGKNDETTIENTFPFNAKAITITNKNDIWNALQNMRDEYPWTD